MSRVTLILLKIALILWHDAFMTVSSSLGSLLHLLNVALIWLKSLERLEGQGPGTI